MLLIILGLLISSIILQLLYSNRTQHQQPDTEEARAFLWRQQMQVELLRQELAELDKEKELWREANKRMQDMLDNWKQA